MAISIHNFIAAIRPDLYCDASVKSKVEKILKESLKENKGYAEAAKAAKPLDGSIIDIDKTKQANPFKFSALKNPIEKHSLLYDAFGESLEPIYFWLIDSIQKEYDDLKKIDKLVDNFISSPGSGHFSEIGMKATKMQEEGMKMLVNANQVLKSILNLIYDLKEFRLRLDLYEKFKSKNEAEKQSALLSLKQIWMDTVDTKRGNTAIKLLAQNFDYVVLIDAFMAANSLDDVKKPVEKGGLDLNERVRRILQQRVQEFFMWVQESETELRKRYEIEKIYLRSQINAIKLYSRWAKPYLRAAQQLEQRASQSAELVTSFNTAIFELTLLVEGEYNPTKEVSKGNLPEMFKHVKARNYRKVLIIEFRFRSAPERVQQGGYGFRGRVDIVFTSYGLNEDELNILREEIERDDLGDTLKLIEGATDESLSKIQEEIDSFLKEGEKEKTKEKEAKKSENPFSALLSIFNFNQDENEKTEEKKNNLSPDSQIEKVLRNQAIIKSREDCKGIYDLYKKAHGMPSM